MAIVSVQLQEGQAVKIQKNKIINPFIAVGKMHRTKGFNFADVMSGLSPVAHKVFWEMVKIRNEDTNVVKIESSQNTQSQNSIISKGYRLLAEAGLLLKIGKGLYLLNPYAILPTFDKCEEVNKEWDRLNETKKR